MHYQRHLQKTHQVKSYLKADSSPQKGSNLLVSRVGDVRWLPGASPETLAGISLGSITERRALPLTCHGYGAADGPSKTLAVLHQLGLELGLFRDELRCNYRGLCTDQSTGKLSG